MGGLQGQTFSQEGHKRWAFRFFKKFLPGGLPPREDLVRSASASRRSCKTGSLPRTGYARPACLPQEGHVGSSHHRQGPARSASCTNPMASVKENMSSLCIPHLTHSSIGPRSNDAPNVVNRHEIANCFLARTILIIVSSVA